MKKRQCFVSNSSSSSFIINSKNRNYLTKDEIKEFLERNMTGDIFIFNKNKQIEGEYGWQWLNICSIDEKINYILNSESIILEDYNDTIHYSPSRIDIVENAIRKISEEININISDFEWSRGEYYYGVDHESYGICVDILDENELMEFLLDKNSSIMNGNDSEKERKRRKL